MRNLKKFLALVLAMMMVFSLMITVSAKSLDEYSDSDAVDKRYAEAVDVLAQLGILQGQGNNSIAPTATLTRVEAATIIYRVITGDIDDEQVGIWSSVENFEDVPADYWGAEYINYAAFYGYVKGDGTNFHPLEKLTGYQLLTILLRAIGYGVNSEYQGSGWDRSALQDASTIGLLNGLTSADINMGKEVTREVMAQIICNALDVELVEYNRATGKYDKQDNGGKYLIKLTPTKITTWGSSGLGNDDWGRPVANYSATWQKVPGHRGTATVTLRPDVEFPDYMEECDVYHALEDLYDLESDEIPVYNYFVDGLHYDEPSVITPNPEGATKSGNIVDINTTLYMGHKGSYTEVYLIDDDTLGQYAWVVERSTYLAQVDEVVTHEVDHNDHVRESDTTFFVYTGNDAFDDDDDPNGTLHGYAVDSSYVGKYVLVNYNKRTEKVEVEDPENLVLAKQQKTALLGGYLADRDTTDKDKHGGLWDNKPGTTKVGDEYANAWQFNLGRSAAKAYDPDEEVPVGHETYYFAITDEAGEVIYGLVADNDRGWLIIDYIEWEHDNTKYGGFAKADVVYADKADHTGEWVTVNSITPFDKDAEVKMSRDNIGNPDLGTVSDDFNNNTAYYYHIFWYTKGADNSLNLFMHPEFDDGSNSAPAPNNRFEAAGNDEANDGDTVNFPGATTNAPYKFYDLEEGTLTQNGHQISGKGLNGTDFTAVTTFTNTIVVNDNTKFLIKTTKDGDYVYKTGRDKIDNLSKAKICVVVDKNSHAVLVVADGSAPAADKYLIAYVPSTPAGTETKLEVYKMTGTGAVKTELKMESDWSTGVSFYAAGLYVFEDADEDNEYTLVTWPNAPVNGTFAGLWTESIAMDTGSFDSGATVGAATVNDTYYFARGTVLGVLDKGNALRVGAYAAGGVSKTNATATSTGSLKDFNIGGAKVVEVTVASDGTTFTTTATEKLDPVKQSEWEDTLIGGRTVIVVYEKDGSTNVAKYIYVYKVVTVEGSKVTPADIELTISHDPDEVGGPLGKFKPNSDGTYSFFVTVGADEAIALDFENCDAESNLVEASKNQDRYEIIVKNIKAGAYVHVYGDTNASNPPTKAGDGEFTKDSDGGMDLDVPALREMYNSDLGIDVDYEDGANITITIDSSTFNNASADKQAQLAKGNFGGSATPANGAAGYVGITIKTTDGNIKRNSFYFDGKFYPEVSPNDDADSENVYITVATWKDGKMELKDSEIHTVRYTSMTNSKVWNVTITVNVI